MDEDKEKKVETVEEAFCFLYREILKLKIQSFRLERDKFFPCDLTIGSSG